MAHKKAGGTTKNGRDSNPKYLGVKLAHGQSAQIGSIVIRQRGSQVLPGNGIKIGRDHTLYAVKDGTIKFTSKRKVHFDGTTMIKKVVSVV